MVKCVQFTAALNKVGIVGKMALPLKLITSNSGLMNTMISINYMVNLSKSPPGNPILRLLMVKLNMKFNQI